MSWSTPCEADTSNDNNSLSVLDYFLSVLVHFSLNFYLTPFSNFWHGRYLAHGKRSVIIKWWHLKTLCPLNLGVLPWSYSRRTFVLCFLAENKGDSLLSDPKRVIIIFQYPGALECRIGHEARSK